MDELTIHTKKVDGELFKAFWVAGEQAGCVPVESPGEVEESDQRVVAELVALHDVLVRQKVFGRSQTGEDLVINVSSGAIRKVTLGRTSKKHLIPYAYWLQGRFADVTVRVPKKPLDVATIENSIIDGSLSESPVLPVPNPDALGENVKTPIGRVRISNHALQRFAEHAGTGTIGEAWRQTLAIMFGMLYPAAMPQKALRKKQKRYQGEETLYLESTNGWQLVLIKCGDDQLVLKTLYPTPEMRGAA